MLPLLILLIIINVTFSTTDHHFQCNNTICSLACSTANECRNHTINASQANIFNLICNASSACENIVITSPPQMNANIYCEGSNACSNAIFDLSTTTESVNIDCRAASTNHLPCNSSIFNANIANTIQVQCGGYSCHHTNFNITNAGTANFSMHTYGAAKYSTIYANGIQNRLTVVCDAQWACFDMKIWANGMSQNGTGINVKCKSGSYGCQQMQVYCPTGDAYCDIDCISSSYPCKDMDIYIENNSYDLDLNCKDAEYFPYGGCHNNLSIICTNTDLHTKLQRSTDTNTLFALECEDQHCCPSFFAEPTNQCIANTACGGMTL